MPNSYATPTNASAITAANSAANATYNLIGQYDLTAAPPHELLIDIVLTPGTTPAGNKQSIFYVTSSIDGSTWSDAPSTSTALNAKRLGRIDHPDNAARRTTLMPVSGLFGGALPRYVRVYVLNDIGVSYASSGNAINAVTETWG